MIHGLDTGFLVAVEVTEHADHLAARNKLNLLIAAGDLVGIVPQILPEFIHVVTDSKRFTSPLAIDDARRIADQWWTAKEVVPLFPDQASVRLFLDWHKQFYLGRKRLLDTLLASTFRHAGVVSVLTTNPADFAIFGCFTCITPSDPVAGP